MISKNIPKNSRLFPPEIYHSGSLLYFVGVLLFLISGISSHILSPLSYILSDSSLPQKENTDLPVLLLGMTLALLIPAMLWFGIIKQKAYLLICLFILLFTASSLNATYDLVSIRSFGDSGWLAYFVDTQTPFSRWLAGTATLGWAFSILKSLAIDIAALTFIKVCGALLITVTTIYVIRKANNRLALLIPLFCPIWLTFISGYDEYYPFIAPLFLIALLLIEHRPLNQQWLIYSAFASLLTLSYIAYAPIAFLVILALALHSRKLALASIPIACFIYILGVYLFWPEGVMEYARALKHDLNLGEQNTIYPAYKEHSASALSPWFSPQYALSWEHFKHLAFMLFWGGGWIIPLLLFGALIKYRAQFINKLPSALRSNPTLSALAAWQTFYFVFMIPKLGPVQDIDLFFSVYLTLGILAGMWFDDLLRNHQKEAHLKYLLLCTISGCSIATSANLLVI